MYITSTSTKPIIVDLRTAACDVALPDITTAPSIPMNSQSVIIIVLRACGSTFSRLNASACPLLLTPQKLSRNTENLNIVMIAIMKTITGTIFPMVPTRLIELVCLAPLVVSKNIAQDITEPTIMAGMVLPPSNMGMK
jgi:hypothetical protein